MRAAVAIVSGLFSVGLARAQAPEPAPTGQGTAAEPGAGPSPTPEATPASAASTLDSPAAAPSEASIGASSVDAFEGGLSEAELRDLGFEGGEAAAVDTSIRFSGFMDFGVQVALNKGSQDLYGKHTAMAIGNANFYVSKNLTESLRTMAEVRLLYLPNGSPANEADPTRIRTAANDYNDFDRPLHWGGIELERIYLEWTAHRLLTIRMGQFLTPYGIWNVDHGSPTIIPTQRPFVIGENWFPERQTGFEFYGRAELSNDSTIGYHLTFSNGTGPFTEYKDLDSNKAVGGRGYWEYHRSGELRVGGSFYYGRDTDSKASNNTSGMGPLTTEKITLQYDQLAFGLDVVWKYRGLHLQGEVLNRQQRFTDAGRTPVFSVVDFSMGYPTDTVSWGGYALGGYRFDWLGVMPYGLLTVIHELVFGLRTKITGIAYAFGLNVRPVDVLALKFQYDYVQFVDSAMFPDDLQFFSAQAAWAF